MSGHKLKRQNMDLNYVRTQVKIEKMDFICPLCKCVRTVQMYVPDKIWILIISGHNSKSQKMDLIYVRAQVKITKYGFFMSNRGPDKEQNIKIWI